MASFCEHGSKYKNNSPSKELEIDTSELKEDSTRLFRIECSQKPAKEESNATTSFEFTVELSCWVQGVRAPHLTMLYNYSNQKGQ